MSLIKFPELVFKSTEPICSVLSARPVTIVSLELGPSDTRVPDQVTLVSSTPVTLVIFHSELSIPVNAKFQGIVVFADPLRRLGADQLRDFDPVNVMVTAFAFVVKTNNVRTRNDFFMF